MDIFNFKDFLVNEKLGVAEPTIFYIKTIFTHTINYLKDFIKSEDKEFNQSIKIPYRRFYREITNREVYSKFPVVGIVLNLEFEKISPYIFNKKYKIEDGDKRPKHAVAGWASRFGHINWSGYSKVVNPIKNVTDHGIIIDIGLNIIISSDYKLEPNL